MLAVCFAMMTTSWATMFDYGQNSSGNETPELKSEQARMETNAPTVISFNTTWTAANSPYYLNGPVSIQVGVRLTIEPGVEVYANTTNSSITAYGELHAEGTVASPIEFGINPSITRNCNQGWWSGIQSSTPNLGNEPLILRNVTMWGTRKVITSGCSGNYNMLNTYNFGRSNSFSALDNITFYDGGNINFQSRDQSASWQINNITIHNMSYVSHSNSDFRERCNGGSWNGKVRITDTNSAYLSNVGYYSSGQSTNYCQIGRAHV